MDRAEFSDDLADQQGQDGHDAQIDSAEQGDLVEDLLDEVGWWACRDGSRE